MPEMTTWQKFWERAGIFTIKMLVALLSGYAGILSWMVSPFLLTAILFVLLALIAVNRWSNIEDPLKAYMYLMGTIVITTCVFMVVAVVGFFVVDPIIGWLVLAVVGILVGVLILFRMRESWQANFATTDKDMG